MSKTVPLLPGKLEEVLRFSGFVFFFFPRWKMGLKKRMRAGVVSHSSPLPGELRSSQLASGDSRTGSGGL